MILAGVQQFKELQKRSLNKVWIQQHTSQILIGHYYQQSHMLRTIQIQEGGIGMNPVEA